MNIKLTLGERLKDLRVERNLKLEALAEQTGLSKSALSKYESDDVTDLSIYAVTTLAEFYDVTTDYLLGVTENKKRPDAVLSDLHLSDGAVDVLRNGKNFQRFMTDLEIYVDGYVSTNIQNLNAGLEATRQMLKKKYAADENDLYMSTLKLRQIDEDEYFGRVLYDELVAILKNIKTEHRIAQGLSRSNRRTGRRVPAKLRCDFLCLCRRPSKAVCRCHREQWADAVFHPQICERFSPYR